MRGLLAQRLFRYVFREVLWPFVLWVLFLLLILFAMQFRKSNEVYLGSAVTGRDMLLLSIYLTPFFLTLAVPVAFLLALLLGLGQLGEDRELLAMYALGTSPAQLLLAPFVLSAALGGVMRMLVAHVTPWGWSQVRAHGNEIIKRNVVGDVKSGTFYEELPQLTLYVEVVQGERRVWHNVLMHDDRDPNAPLLVVARKGQVNPRGPGEELQLVLEEGEIHQPGSGTDYRVIAFEDAEFAVGVSESLRRKNRFRAGREEMTLGELGSEAKRASAENRSGDAMYLRVGIHQRWAQVFTPLAFALIGCPLAMSRRKGGRARGFLLSLAGYIVYYVLGRTFDNLGAQGKLPLLVAAQLPNFIFAALGAFAFWATFRGGPKP